MKSKIKIFGLLIAVFFTYIACEEDKIETYSGNNNIYFKWAETATYIGNISERRDSVGFSFALIEANVKEMLVKVPITLQGEVSMRDRKVNVVVDESSTAVEGVDFDLPQNIMFRAGYAIDSIPVTFYRTPSMKDKTISLALRLESNEDFDIEYKTLIDNNKLLELTRLTLTINDIIQRPASWFDFYLGDFSGKKIFLMKELLGVEPADFDTQGLIPISNMLYYGSFMQRYLNEQSLAGNTIYEEDGTTPMMMGLGVQ